MPTDAPWFVSEEISHTANTARERVIVFLAFLTSEECRQACQGYLPPEHTAFELCRLWFDDIYLPGARYLDGVKGDRDEEAIQQFKACFTDDEWAALERFHRFFELRLEMLPESHKQAASIPQNDLWRNIVKDASYLLDTLATDPEQIRRSLAWIVGQFAEGIDDDPSLREVTWHDLLTHAGDHLPPDG